MAELKIRMGANAKKNVKTLEITDNNMIIPCFTCCGLTEHNFIKTSEWLFYKGRKIEVYVEYWKCIICGEEYEDPKSNYDCIKTLYDEYERLYE